MKRATLWLASLVVVVLACTDVPPPEKPKDDFIGNPTTTLMAGGGAVNFDGVYTTTISALLLAPGDPRRFLVGFEDEANDIRIGKTKPIVPSGPMDEFGWGFIDNPGPLMGGGFWTRCNAESTNEKMGAFQCPKPMGLPPLDPKNTGKIDDFVRWVGKPTLVSDRVRGNVVYIGLYSTTQALPPTDNNNWPVGDKLMAILSETNGTTFGDAQENYVPINEAFSGQGCDHGIQDLPDATIDHSTSPPTIYVVWRNKQASSFGGCIRAFQLLAKGTSNCNGVCAHSTIVPVTPSHIISGMSREFDLCTGCGQGALKVGASDGLITVVYSNDDSQLSCIPNGNKKMRIAWESVETTDMVNWTNNTTIVHSPPNFLDTCVWDASPTNRIERGLQEFDHALAPDGNEYVAVNDTSQSIRLYMSPTRGVLIPHTGAVNNSSWREWCPTSFVGSPPPPAIKWAPMGAACPTPLIDAAAFGGPHPEANQVWRPTLIADANSRLVLTFMVLVPNAGFTDATISFHYLGDVFPRNGVNPGSLVSNVWQAPTSPPSSAFPTFTATSVGGGPGSFAVRFNRIGLYNSGIVAPLFPPPAPQALAPAVPDDLPNGAGGDRLFVPLWPEIDRNAGGTDEMFDEDMRATYVLLTNFP